MNEVILDEGKCILQLAPYMNGMQKKDRSINPDIPALKIDDIARELSKLPPDTPVVVQLRGEFAHWRDIVQKDPLKAELDSRHGLFLRLA